MTADNGTYPYYDLRLFDYPVTPQTTDEWYTPRWIFRALDVMFDLDVCAPADPELRSVPARRYYTAAEDGLTQPWDGYVWMNPPYSRAAPWVDRWVAHGYGMALLPALPEVQWRGVLLGAADAMALLAVNFTRPSGREARLLWPCILAAVGPDAARHVAAVAAADLYAAGAFHVAKAAAP
ncbi:MAG TPA: DNA N-6-adenine-methyltransferase [Mycobacterium sp.]